MVKGEWKIQLKGGRNPKSGWEVSLVRLNNQHGQQSYGWCDSDISDYSKCKKILIGEYTPAHCSGVMVPEAMQASIELAERFLDERL